LDELATLVAVLLRLRADRAAFLAAQPHVLALANPLARLAVGRALRATRPPEATVAPGGTSPAGSAVRGPGARPGLGPEDPAALEAAVLELLRQARGPK
jgi:hypothetical protein